MTTALILLLLVIAATLIFEYANGANDAANAIATVVSTKVLSPRNAILFAAVFNFLGAFAGTKVATTIGSGIVDIVDQPVILCGLFGAIFVTTLATRLGVPISCSHALIGGLIGAAVAHNGIEVLHVDKLINKIIKPMFASPLIGFIVGFLLMLALLWMVAKMAPEKINKKFKFLQIFSAGIMAFSHGSNDAQKAMGVIALSLWTYARIENPDAQFVVPLWVIFICAVTMGLGTAVGGWKVIRTIGHKMLKLKPIHGFAAETTAAATILTCSQFGIPVSTTHIISTAIMGVGSTIRLSAVKWGIVGKIVTAWFLTIPLSAAVAAALYKVFLG
jgi:PiT family inorganic phosphate transporter